MRIKLSGKRYGNWIVENKVKEPLVEGEEQWNVHCIHCKKKFIANRITILKKRDQCYCRMANQEIGQRNQQILKDRLERKMTLQEIGDKYGISRQRAHQIVAGCT